MLFDVGMVDEAWVFVVWEIVVLMGEPAVPSWGDSVAFLGGGRGGYL